MRYGLTAALREVLRDGDWHPVLELEAIAVPLIRVEVAIRRREARIQRGPADDELHRWVREGRHEVIREALMHMGAEQEKRDGEWWARWRPVQTACAGCGKSITYIAAEKPRTQLCPSCWHTGVRRRKKTDAS